MTEENTSSGHTSVIMDAISKDDVYNNMVYAFKLLQERDQCNVILYCLYLVKIVDK